MNVLESLLFEVAVLCTLASQFLIVIVGMSFVVCALSALGLEVWLLARRLSGGRALPPQQTVPDHPWAVPANQLADAHR